MKKRSKSLHLLIFENFRNFAYLQMKIQRSSHCRYDLRKNEKRTGRNRIFFGSHLEQQSVIQSALERTDLGTINDGSNVDSRQLGIDFSSPLKSPGRPGTKKLRIFWRVFVN